MSKHFEGRPHRYKAICFCPVCDKETRLRVSQFWELPPEAQAEVAIVAKNGDEEEDECDCGNCYDCMWGKIFSLPEYVMPLM